MTINLPRLAVVRSAVHALIALPIPGYYTIDDCTRHLLGSKRKYPPRPWTLTADAMMRAWRRSSDNAKVNLRYRSAAILSIVSAVRELLRTAGVLEWALPNVAADLTVASVIECGDRNVRGLIFMRQFETVAGWVPL
ncbi:hypothetical protein BDK51DRAFT_39132 [Blyttiomyces helicus]|uniref:Uncharacterized protein n=1 Tax=Blyttiomyces helicus TaxID=388810 RepID=A0A4P9W9I2_9FUNG|nr:hypothetical protein BDK51DRAFT_39132 [Blyttiomyces helicus]|eukprot:RKO88175.1 hypothetical protein BDK51DRAFT_39132 [Blyttiomyces helicus]